MHLHLGALIQVEFISDHGFVAGCQTRPGLIRSPVIVLHLAHLNVIIKPDDTLVPELLYRRSIAQLPHEHVLGVLDLLLHLLLTERMKYIALLELAWRGPQRQLPVQSDFNLFAFYLALCARAGGQYVAVD